MRLQIPGIEHSIVALAGFLDSVPVATPGRAFSLSRPLIGLPLLAFVRATPMEALQ